MPKKALRTASPEGPQAEIGRKSATGIDHLVVIAGPEAAGKSTLVKKLRYDQLVELNALLAVDNFEQYQRLTLGSIRHSPPAKLNRLVLFECNTLSAYCRQLNYANDARMTQLLHQARRISIVTVWTPPDKLRRQRIGRDLRRIRKSLPVYGYRRALRFAIFFLFAKTLDTPLLARLTCWTVDHKRLQSILTWFCTRYFTFYLLPAEIVRAYHDWVQFCDTLQTKTRHHYIAELDRRVRLHSRDDWHSLITSSRPSLP